MSPTRPRRVAVLADTDSRWKWGMLTAGQLEPTEAVLPCLLQRSDPPSARQFHAAGVDPDAVLPLSMAELPHRLAAHPPDVLVIALGGGGVIATVHALLAGWPAGLRRPVLVSGYFGVVYEKLVEGLAGRAGTDVVLANSPADVERFRTVYTGLGIDPAPVVETSLPFLPEPAARRASRPFTLTFATQPSVPASQADRSDLVDRLVRHARLHPERRVLLKLRSMPGERVTHAEPYPYPALLRRVAGDLPPNLQLDISAMDEVLVTTDLLVTVSSTAALEAMHAGVPTVLLTDFGVRESLGNAHFVGSGCLASFDEIDDGRAPVTDAAWARRHGVGGAGPEAFRARVADLLDNDLPPLLPYYTLRRSPAYLPWLLADYGLAPDGTAAHPVPDQPGEPVRLLRRAVRSTARSVYRTGAEVVAPALRKWGAL
ncbi:MAG: DUF6716 putative glycosyltransferase [Propionicimonas sp.]|nr:DUF6716 putative glycosyltransferase [Propionicimonas sp.]